MPAKKQAEPSLEDEIRAFITDHPTASDATVQGELKGSGTPVSRDLIQTVRAEMGDKHTWEETA